MGRGITTKQADREFLEVFLGTLAEHGLESDDLVFRGFDGAPIKQKGENPDADRHDIWVLDEKFWRWALTTTSTATAIEYAEYHRMPCVGVYDLNQLRVSEKGEPSSGLLEVRASSEEGIFNRVTHVDYPKALPAAALQGLVFFEYAD